ncbi:stemmadenine O-acetyltransferase-like [Salvia divinorum]|uniref:Stemmadenine O-acetyltransferase-like n=1 Tax=Salvia divinorum TaxID=28513 RepID=A0ABD1FNJ9_SALDI
MTMNVEIISMEMIKPSSPTPNHLRHYKLNLLDQLIPAAYAPIVIFFPNHDAAAPFQVDLLKKSLSETLTRFFPLAGTIKADELSIDCDDQGACFTKAKANCSLNDFLKCPDLKQIAQFLPCGLTSTGLSTTNVQATEFECGGMALGVCISHRVVDGAALSFFLKSWANTAANVKSSLAPDFSASRLFPVDGSWLRDASMVMWGSLFKKGKFVTNRFVFGSVSVALLKARATAVGGSSPTRVEAVSGFIWKHAMAAYAERFGSKNEPSLLTHLVNLRTRAAPKFSQESLGNLIWIASAMCEGEGDLGLPALVDEVRRSISGVDGQCVKKLGGEGGSKTMLKFIKEIEQVGSENVHHLGFSSWCKLGFYEVDFGWGTPVWVSSIDTSGPCFMNLVVLIDTRSGDGMEAWVTLEEQEMAVLEHDQEFTSFASLNLSPL